MIHALVTYCVKPEFAEENKANIRTFMKDFHKLRRDNFSYSVFVKEDGITFIHVSGYASADVQKQILATPSFLDFQKKRDDSGLKNSPVICFPELVDATPSFFDEREIV